jgi:murein DD-endopeptidase MepM/ murein hydrolase activator NlpD
MASGGQVGRKSANVTRKIRAKRIQKPTKQITQRTMPGKNVGGRENIEKLFPSSDDPNTMSPLRVLTKNSSVMKGGGVLGKFLSSGVELMALGQKMERSTLIGLEKYLAYVIDSSIQDQSNENSKRIAGSMLAMAEGGLVPVSRTITEKASPGSIVAKDIVKSFNSTMNTKSAEILQNIKKEISLFKPGATPGDIKSGFGESGSFVSGDYEELLNLIAEKESKDSGGYNAYNEGGAGGGYQVIGYSGPAINGPIGKNLTDMTIAEIMEHQANKNPPIHAAGRYQIIGQTMKGLLSGRYGDTGVKTTDKFTPEIQDKLAIALIRSRLSTGANTKNFINEWRGLLFVDQNKLQSAIEKAKGGKINLNFGASTNLGMTYRTNTMNNQYYGAPRPGRIHAGVDLDLGSNDSQITFLGGIVQYIGHQIDSQGREYGYGKFVDILTPTGMIERLAELGTLDPSVRVGAKVSPGQIISRGESFSGVTHLEYRKPGTSGITGTIDPLEYLRKLKIIEGGNTFKFKGAKKNEVSSLTSPMKLSSKQETQTPANYISNKKTYTDTTKETQILIQPIIT